MTLQGHHTLRSYCLCILSWLWPDFTLPSLAPHCPSTPSHSHLYAVIPLYFYLRPSSIYEAGAAEVWIAKLCGVTAAGCSVFLLPPVTKTLTDNLRRVRGAQGLVRWSNAAAATPGLFPLNNQRSTRRRRIPGMTRLFNFDANISSQSPAATRVDQLCLPWR